LRQRLIRRLGYPPRVDLWTLIAGGLIGVGGLIVTTVNNLVARVFQNKDKERDRRIALDDRRLALEEQHRGDLRAAYVEFITAYSNLLDSLGVLMARVDAVEEQREKQYQFVLAETKSVDYAEQARNTAASPELIRLAKEESERLPDEVKAANAKAVGIILLESDPDLAERLRDFTEAPLRMPAGRRDHARATRDIGERRAKLDGLILALAGRFAPAHHLPAAPTGSTPAKPLPSG
jgi:hypothetical protein